MYAKYCNLGWSLALCIKSCWASVSSLFPHIYFVNRHVVKKEDHGITHTRRIVYRPTIKALLTKTRNQKNAICVDISLKMFLGMAIKWILWWCLFKNKLIENVLGEYYVHHLVWGFLKLWILAILLFYFAIGTLS